MYKIYVKMIVVRDICFVEAPERHAFWGGVGRVHNTFSSSYIQDVWRCLLEITHRMLFSVTRP